MIESAQEDLWRIAYRRHFGSNPDQDMATHRDDVESWRDHWLDAYNNREEWAMKLAHGDEAAA